MRPASIYFGPLFVPYFSVSAAPMQSQESADLVIAPRWLLPMDSPAALRGHAVAITSGRIVAVAPDSEICARFAPRERLERPDHVLLPGFVNAHTRASHTLLRGLPVHAPLMRWVREVLAPAELRALNPDFVRSGTQLAIAEMLRAGITAFAGSDAFPEEAARAAAEARVRAVIGLPVSSDASAYAEDATAHFVRAERLWDEYRSSPWVSLYFAPPPAYAIDDSLLTHLRSVADELDARIAMPLHESELEVRDSLGQHGKRPLRRLADLGLLRPGFTAVHLNRLDPTDLATARDTGIAVVACPQSDLRLGSGRCAIEVLKESGIATGLGTGSPVAAGAFDLLAEAKLAAQLAWREMEKSGAGGDLSAELSSAFALRLATFGGAQAIGLGEVCGTLTPGKAADLTCIEIGAQAAAQPAASIADAVLFSCTRQHVTDVWVGGRAAVANRQLLAFDEQELRHLAQQWAERARFGEDL